VDAKRQWLETFQNILWKPEDVAYTSSKSGLNTLGDGKVMKAGQIDRQLFSFI